MTCGHWQEGRLARDLTQAEQSRSGGLLGLLSGRVFSTTLTSGESFLPLLAFLFPVMPHLVEGGENLSGESVGTADTQETHAQVPPCKMSIVPTALGWHGSAEVTS